MTYFQGTDCPPNVERKTHLRIVSRQGCNGSLKHTLHLSSFEKTHVLSNEATFEEATLFRNFITFEQKHDLLSGHRLPSECGTQDPSAHCISSGLQWESETQVAFVLV